MTVKSHVFGATESIEVQTTANADGTSDKKVVFNFTDDGGSAQELESTNAGIIAAAEAILENGYLTDDASDVTLRYEGTTVKGLDYKTTKTSA